MYLGSWSSSHIFRYLYRRLQRLGTRTSTAGLPIRWTVRRRHNFCRRGPILNPRPVFEPPAQTTRVNVLDFFVKSKNGLV